MQSILLPHDFSMYHLTGSDALKRELIDICACVFVLKIKFILGSTHFVSTYGFFRPHSVHLYFHIVYELSSRSTRDFNFSMWETFYLAYRTSLGLLMCPFVPLLIPKRALVKLEIRRMTMTGLVRRKNLSINEYVTFPSAPIKQKCTRTFSKTNQGFSEVDWVTAKFLIKKSYLNRVKNLRVPYPKGHVVLHIEVIKGLNAV
jgi:hypothetical protein